MQLMCHPTNMKTTENGFFLKVKKNSESLITVKYAIKKIELCGKGGRGGSEYFSLNKSEFLIVYSYTPW